MNPLTEPLATMTTMMNVAGLAGLVLLAAAALRIGAIYGSTGIRLVASGAVCLLLARLYFVASPYFMSQDFEVSIGPLGIAIAYGLPPLLLTFGFAGVVWGLWSHERNSADWHPKKTTARNA